MKKPILTLTLFLTLLLLSCSSNRELVDLSYSEKIDEHIVWKVIKSDDINGSPASINILDIDLNEFEGDLLLAWYKDSLIKTSDIAIQHDGFAAINGSFFDMRAGGSVLFLQEDGEMIAETHDKKSFVNSGAYAVDTNGVVTILKRDGEWAYSPAYDDIMVSGPIMIHNDKFCELDQIGFNLRRHPRTAIGITDDYHLLLITVDGRHAEAAGMTMWELQIYMDKLGCRDALNFDGGGSTTMYIKGKTPNGVVNYPSDNGKYDHEGERSVANALVVTGN
ncbi:MAG: phosphodiester glycosidase family protein [Candidatus Marinimicrobia bacterium]|nr:phosphodiester glycosidase family protein [Candidatus Neomarinimicrobiota bacterium]